MSLPACGLVFPTRVSEQGTETEDAPGSDAALHPDAASPQDATLAHDATLPPEAGAADAADAADATDATLHDSSTGDAAVDAPCNHVVPPPPPAQGSPGPDTVSFVSAFRLLTGIEPGDAGGTLGFDLDGVCTCPGPPSCISAVTPPSMNCDEPGGRDLQGEPLFVVFDQAFAVTELGDFSQRIAEGRLNLLLAVSDYNGGPDDTQVTVAAYGSNGLRDPDGGAYVPPRWNGADEWNVDPASWFASTLTDAGWHYTPSFFTTSAYVTQNTLVARFDDGITFDFGFTSTLVRDAVLTATIAADPAGGYDLSGNFGGRIATADIFDLMGRLTVGADAGRLCGANPLFQGLSATVCQSADIMSSAAVDNTNAVCDALSIAVGFSAFPAELGAPYDLPETPFGCDGSVYQCSP